MRENLKHEMKFECMAKYLMNSGRGSQHSLSFLAIQYSSFLSSPPTLEENIAEQAKLGAGYLAAYYSSVTESSGKEPTGDYHENYYFL